MNARISNKWLNVTHKMTNSLFFGSSVIHIFGVSLHFCLKPLGEHMPKACNKTQKACDRHLVNQFTSGGLIRTTLLLLLQR